jgi:hypothetical protein
MKEADKIIILICFAAILWTFRYDLEPSNHTGSLSIYRLDRWTGSVYLCGNGECREFR